MTSLARILGKTHLIQSTSSAIPVRRVACIYSFQDTGFAEGRMSRSSCHFQKMA